jgi:uncharacterized membrane protein YcaP (DUF421 family)
MRVVRLEPGTVGIADLLMVVLIADASQNAMAGDCHSILDGLILVLTIVFWNFLMDWLTLHSRTVERLTYPDPVALVQNRKMNRPTMSKQFVTENQLLSISTKIWRRAITFHQPTVSAVCGEKRS